MILSGKHVPNPSELLDSPNMRKLLEKVEGNYDYILLDAPPILSVHDPAILGSIADGVIFVVKHEEIKKKQLQDALLQIRNVGGMVLGTILSQYNAKKDFSNRRYDKYRYYDYYSEDNR